ncbi:acyl-CoA-binding domain-containing protein 1-like protein [Polychytrium aggregatum]|uniref:acyl-CoA-binding domain-containing protein 1-like protein n=1 Tax=Polychytrium aggregatum TaxID=110093 RepID=UPI0022FE1F13|nr:acyl-CoA-binding domain-containing protein 1-like protein [Polychytrium aggregatum]KAI9208464.1 acyl-CoA-binding domain-containing protein 1-like protein [Polychytrium aggregatum]
MVSISISPPCRSSLATRTRPAACPLLPLVETLQLHRMDTQELFTEAAEYLTSRKDLKFERSVLLKIYALYKVGTLGPNNTPQPGYFDFTGRAKWDAWKSHSHLSKEEAQELYIQLVDEVRGGATESLQQDGASGSASSESGTGVAVSTMGGHRAEIADADKTIFEWAEEGNLERVKKMIENGAPIDGTDEQGMTLLHWASDREYQPLVEYLIARGANVNAQDREGQTPLHLAATVENAPIAQLLLDSGADLTLADAEGTLCQTLIAESSMRLALRS